MTTVNTDLTVDQAKRLDRLAKDTGCNSTSDFLQLLLDHVDEGIRRPDCWERPWLAQITGEGPLAAGDELRSRTAPR
jgi:hypothetical protein